MSKIFCPACGQDDFDTDPQSTYYCRVCGHEWNDDNKFPIKDATMPRYIVHYPVVAVSKEFNNLEEAEAFAETMTDQDWANGIEEPQVVDLETRRIVPPSH